ncbi:MAG: sulfatase [Deltaproteobacteria bacterium]|nr:sulfatase [Deltaproteobacteria bacterium]
MKRLHGLIAAGLGFWVMACGGGVPGITDEPETIEFGDYLSVADIEGRVEPLTVSGAESFTEFRMAAGSRLTLHFALPDGASLVGEESSAAPPDDGGRGRVRVVVTADGDSPPHVIEGPSPRLLADEPLNFREDLSALSGEMARFRISCERVGTGGGTCAWRSLRIEGTRAQPMAPVVARDRYNVFVIMLDSLRQDHLEPYGASDVRTPRLAQFAETGVTFENARSNASWTRSAVAAMLTSLPPPAHGVLTLDDSLVDGIPYLPEILQRSGYRTVAVINNPNASGSFGFARGFDEMIEFWAFDKEALKVPNDPEGQAKFVWSHYIKPTVRGSEPFFVFLHELDPHSPYEPPEPFRSEYGFDYQGKVDSTMSGLLRMREFPDQVTPEDVRHINALYKGEVAFMDRYVGWMLDRLAGLPLERPILIVFVSDHGEEFWEHRSVGHAQTVHEELLRVPFLMQLDGVLPAGRRVRADVTLADLAPTVLDLLGIEIPESMQGQTLLPLVSAPDDLAAPRPAIARGIKALAEESISLGRWKLIRNIGRQASAIALYDLEDDPGETHDRASERPIIAATLAQRLRWHFDRDPFDSAAPKPGAAQHKPDPVVLQRLKELGYIE